MGQYLTIGIATEVSFNEKKAIKVFGSKEAACEHVEKRFADKSLFDAETEDGWVCYSIKSDVFMRELSGFLQAIYSQMYVNDSDYMDEVAEVMNRIKECEDFDSVMQLAGQKSYSCFQCADYWESDYEETGCWERLEVQSAGIVLALQGKIIMECYQAMFEFFETMIRKGFSKFLLSKAIRVKIYG